MASKTLLLSKLENAPTLNTVLMVEQVLANTPQSVIKVADLKRLLPRQVNHNTLMTILHYLENSNKIVVSLKGITWISEPNAALKKALKNGLEL